MLVFVAKRMVGGSDRSCVHDISPAYVRHEKEETVR